jgi:hypothetical protein
MRGLLGYDTTTVKTTAISLLVYLISVILLVASVLPPSPNEMNARKSDTNLHFFFFFNTGNVFLLLLSQDSKPF